MDEPINQTDRLKEFLWDDNNKAAFKITLEQLRLLYFLKLEGSLSGVAKRLNKDQSSVKRSLDSLEDHLGTVVKSQLYARDSGRGKNPLTTAGDAAETLATNVLSALRHFAGDYTPDGKFVIHIGLTTFLLGFVKTLLLRLQNEREHFTTQLLHVRTGNLENKVLSREVHCAFGGKTVELGKSIQFKRGIAAREIQRDSFGFMTNYEPDLAELSIRQIVNDKMPLILPRTGVIYEFIRAELNASSHKEVEERISIVEWCDDVHFAFELMRLDTRRLGMFVLKGVYPHYKTFNDPESSRPLVSRFFDLPDCHYETAVAFLTNEDEMSALGAHHPLREFQQIAETWIDSRK